MHLSSWSKTSLAVCLILLGLLIGIRLAAPSILTWYVNQTIDSTQGIIGQVEDVDLALIAGSYSVKGINIRQLGDDHSRPLFVADKLDISLQWSALLKGYVKSQIYLQNPTIGLYDQPKDKVIENQAITEQKTWLGLANNLTPFEINQFKINNGTFLIDAKSQVKQSQFVIQRIELEVDNIANTKAASELASAQLTGYIQNQAKITVNGKFDPNSAKPNFDFNFEMAKLPVKYIQQLMEIYAPFDFAAGQIDMASELKAEHGQVNGYIKMGIYQLDIFSWHQDVVVDNDNPFTLLVEALGGLMASLFENGKKDLVATRVPVEGTFDSPEVSSWQAFLGILRNAFIEAYNLKVENSVGQTPAKS